MFRQLYGIKQLTTITKCDSANVQIMPKAYLTSPWAIYATIMRKYLRYNDNPLQKIGRGTPRPITLFVYIL